MAEYVVRDGTKEDMPKVLALIQELVQFENVPLSEITINATDLIRDGFEVPHPFFFTLILEEVKSKDIVGYSLCNYAYSSWTGRAIYIEDIYVAPTYRGRGLGHKLFKAICQKAVEEQVWRLDWHVLQSNRRAIQFYSRHGAYDLVERDSRTAFRMDKKEIEAVANAV